MSYENFIQTLDQKTSRNKIKEGINLAAEMVKPTLGCSSRRIIVQEEYRGISAIDDGKVILEALKVKDPQIQAGIDVVKECATKQDEEGDGTTSTSLILCSLVNSLLQEDSQEELLFKKTSGNNLRLRKELKTGLKKVLDYIDKNKIEITTKEQLAQVGAVSSNDKEIGDILADMFDKLGKDGAVSISEGTSIKTESEVVSGYSFDQGWLAPHFATNEKEEAVLVGDPYTSVLVTQNKLQDYKHMQKLAELFEKEGVNDLLIIADDVSGIPLNSLVVNKMRQVIRVCAVKAPQLGTQAETLQDICAVTGATLIGGSGGPKFEEIKPEHLGKAQKVVVSKDKTIIIGLQEDNKKLEERIKVLEGRVERESSEYEKKKLLERISKLRCGVGNIKVGGTTPLEIKDKKAKITDAVAAVKSAMKGGIVAGGGVALLLASLELDEKIEGEKILKKAIQTPFEQIMENADVNISKEKVFETGLGYNVETEEFCDLVKAGIVDPANVVKAEVENSVSTAIMVSNIGGALTLIRKKKEENDETN